MEPFGRHPLDESRADAKRPGPSLAGYGPIMTDAPHDAAGATPVAAHETHGCRRGDRRPRMVGC